MFIIRNIIFFSFFLSIIIFGITFRIYNLNIENFWIDEMVTFWISDPKISIHETIRRNIDADLHFFFNLLLKIYFNYISYEVDLARYLPATLSILSIFLIIYLSIIIKNKNPFFLTFLISFNIYFIKYAQELRSYSLIVFLTIICLIFFFKIVDEQYKKKFVTTLLFILSQALIVLTHIYGLIIVFSFIIFNLISYFKFKKKNIYLNFSSLISGVISVIFLIVYLKNISHTVDWYPKIEFKFFTNLYFSKFFGSRLLGLFHLVLLMYLVFKSKILLLKKYDQRLIFLLIIIFGYFIPVTYSLIIKPILLDKYIIFILVPVLILISNLIYLIKNNLLKKIIISLIVLMTIGNLFTETVVNQFFSKRKIHKPDLRSVFIEINKSGYKKYSFNLEKGNWTNERVLNEIVKNYSNKYLNKINIKLNYIYYENSAKILNNNTKFLWLVCLYDINGTTCATPKNLTNAKIRKNLSYNRVNLKLLEF